MTWRQRIHWFDVAVMLFAAFLLSGITLKLFFPELLRKTLKDHPQDRFGIITAVLDPDYEWLAERIRPGDALWDSLEDKNWMEIMGKRVAESAPLKGRTLVDIRVLVQGNDAGPTAFGRYPIRIGERFFFNCPQYVFHCYIVDRRNVH